MISGWTDSKGSCKGLRQRLPGGVGWQAVAAKDRKEVLPCLLPKEGGRAV